MKSFKIEHHCSDCKPSCNPPCNQVRFTEVGGVRLYPKSEWFSAWDAPHDALLADIWNSYNIYSRRIYVWSDKKMVEESAAAELKGNVGVDKWLHLYIKEGEVMKRIYNCPTLGCEGKIKSQDSVTGTVYRCPECGHDWTRKEKKWVKIL